MTRRKARELIMQMLFERDFHEDTERDDLFNQRMQEIEDSNSKAFIEKEYKGIIAHLEEIDETIQKYSQNWSLKRIAKVDLMILRLAVYELLWEKDIPKKVVVNEALEIAKTYSTEKSPKFINGILGQVIASTEASIEE